ncbi:MAG: CoA transferase [Chloroflexi bacterium]|nr:CoA transferase [Chloroflexota bacterium]
MADGGLLSGIRVVDWTLFQAGPYAAQMLAGLGAEVIHVEEPRHGDQLRYIHRSLGIDFYLPGDRNALFESFDLNKKSLTLDLKSPRGKEIILELAEKSDVFITNFRQSAVERLGLTYGALRPRNPRLVYCSVSAFGRHGPDAGAPGADDSGQARAGSMRPGPDPDHTPVISLPHICDRVTAFMAAFGIVAALNGRSRNGGGQEMHVSLLGSMMCLQDANLVGRFLLGGDPEGARPLGATRRPYKCKDGKWILAGGAGAGRWPKMCQALGRPDLAVDPRFAEDLDRANNAYELVEVLKAVYVEKDSRGWIDTFKKHEIVVSPINDYDDLADDPQVIANRYVIDWDHPALGRVKFPGFPVEFSETPWQIYRPAPELGEHTEEVLVNVLGYSRDKIERLRSDGII